MNDASGTTSLTFSIVICTRNRARYLPGLVDSLFAQTYPRDRYELIIVDNGSEDETRQTAERLQQQWGDALRYIYEPVLGLSQARNSGARHANHEIVAYIDDDALATSGWLRALADAYQAAGPDAGCVGGRITLKWEDGHRPDWLPVELESYLGATDYLGPTMRDLAAPQYPHGGNYTVRASLFPQIGYFSTQLARKGSSLLSNEEAEFCARVRAAGGRVVYTPAALVLHQVLSYRVRPPYLLRRAYWQGISDALTEQQLTPTSRAYLSRQILAGGRNVAVDLWRLLLASCAWNRSRQLLTLFTIVSQLGRLRQKTALLFAAQQG